jgi:uncharacterized membrane protein YkoI
MLPTESKMLFLLSGLRNSRSHSAEKLPGVSTKGRNPIGSWTHQIIIRTFKALPLKPSYHHEVAQRKVHPGEKLNSMKLTRWLVYSAFLWSCMLAVTLSAREKRLKKSDLPAAVQKVADQQSQGATVRGYSSETEDGKLQYEVSLSVDGHTKDVTIAPDGTINEVEEQVFLEKLPPSVRDALQKKTAPGQILKVESLTKHDQLVAYEVQVTTGGKKSEIQVGPDGGDLAHPE